MRGGDLDVKIKCLQNTPLHCEDFLFCVGVVSDVNKVLDDGGINLFILAGNEHGGYSDELELGAIYLLPF